MSGAGAWSQLEQLLTCAICLDRYRNPKLLPCHHTYCQEPCLEGLVDYARRQIKCPECRAEHRIPYQGVQTFPTNVTLCRFLELHRGITGEEPEPIPSMMERCGVCSEKSSVEKCAHCDKKICPECKEAHLDILRRELNRINSQVRRALQRLQDSVSQTEKNHSKLVQNQVTIKDEIEETVRRFVKDIKDKETRLLHELNEYSTTECQGLIKLQQDLDIEATNIGSNCDLIEKHVLEQSEPWTDTELVEYKDIFLKTLDFLRNFDPDTSDYTRRIRFIASTDLDILRKTIHNFGELKLPVPEGKDMDCFDTLPQQSGGLLSVPQGTGLMRSQSDHRLAAQFAKTERQRYLEVSGSTTRLSGDSDGRGERSTSPSFGRRTAKESETSRYGSSRYGEDTSRTGSRYGRTTATDDPYGQWARPDDPDSGRGSQFKSRFMRERNAEALEDEEFATGHRKVQFEEPTEVAPKVFDTSDATRGPLSGVVRLVDTAHLMERLHQNEIKGRFEKERKAEEARIPVAPTPAPYQPPRPRPIARQVSEDEIEKQKQANKVAAAATAAALAATAAATPTPPSAVSERSSTTSSRSAPSEPLSKTSSSTDSTSRYLPRRVTTLREEPAADPSGGSRRGSDASVQSSRRGSDASSTTLDDADDDDPPSLSLPSTRLARRRKSSDVDAKDVTTMSSPYSAGRQTSTSSSTSSRSLRQQSTLGSQLSVDADGPATPSSRRNSGPSSSRLTRQSTLDSSLDVVQEGSSSTTNTSAAPTTVAKDSSSRRSSLRDKDSSSGSTTAANSSGGTQGAAAAGAAREPKMSYYARMTAACQDEGSNPSGHDVSDDDEEDDEEEDEEETEEDEDEDEDEESDQADEQERNKKGNRGQDDGLPTAVAALLSRSAQVRRDSVEFRQVGTDVRARSSSLQLGHSIAAAIADQRRGSGSWSSQPRTRPRAARTVAEEGVPRSPGFSPSSTSLDSTTMLYTSDKDSSRAGVRASDPRQKRTELADQLDTFNCGLPLIARSRTSSAVHHCAPTHHGSLSNETTNNMTQSSLSLAYSTTATSNANANVPKNGRSSKLALTAGQTSPANATTNWYRSSSRATMTRSKSTHLIAENDDSDDDTTTTTSYSSPARTQAPTSLKSSRSNSINTDNLMSTGRRSSTYQYRTRQTRDEDSQSKEQTPASDTGSWATYLRTKYGNSRTGSQASGHSTSPTKQMPRSKSSHTIYNRTGSDTSEDDTDHSSRRSDAGSSAGFSFPRNIYLQKRKLSMKVGTRGTERSQFTWPRGVAVGPDNSIAVADSSNHRVQVFDSQSRFMFEFGSYGSGDGEFDCLAGVAVNRIGQFIVSDRYNHRIQIFDPSGKFLRTFGSEGRADGKFSYPWGITTDSLGFIYVCDKENHRIQVFQSDGTFVGKFGSIGSRPGQLEHPHYVAVSNTNRVIVSDSNNHRIQIFDVNGRSLSTFGSEGSEDGQFKFPRGVAVDDQGYIIVGDSGNNRIQVFNPDGSFLKSFGSWGSGEGEFKGLEGVAVSTTGSILICDRENHRIQVF